MKIIHKDKWGFFILTWYTYIVEGENGELKEVNVNKHIWNKFNVGDYYDPHYNKFYKI